MCVPYRMSSSSNHTLSEGEEHGCSQQVLHCPSSCVCALFTTHLGQGFKLRLTWTLTGPSYPVRHVEREEYSQSNELEKSDDVAYRL